PLVIAARQILSSEGDARLNSLVDHALVALGQLQQAWSETEEPAPADLLQAMLEFAVAAEKCDLADQAYDVAASALDVGPTTAPEIEALARFCIENGSRANRLHQVVVCRARLATCVIAAAQTEPARRLEAFTLAEHVVETLALAPERFRPLVIGPLMP